MWQDALDEVVAFTKEPAGKALYAWRKETIERSFAEAKENHGLRYARMLGIKNMYEQSFLTAAVQNMKRLVAAFLLFFSVNLLIIKPRLLEKAGFVSTLGAAAESAAALWIPSRSAKSWNPTSVSWNPCNPA